MATVTTEADLSDDAAQPGALGRRRFWALTLGSIGVVYGDIGTSPLYAVREAVLAAAGPALRRAKRLSLVFSLIVWALILIVSIKYVMILLRPTTTAKVAR